MSNTISILWQAAKVAIIIVTKTRFFHDSQVMPRCCVAAGCDSVSGKWYSFHKFPERRNYAKKVVNAEVTGLGHPQILSCAPGISKTIVL